MPDKLRNINRSVIHNDFIERLAKNPHPVKQTSIEFFFIKSFTRVLEFPNSLFKFKPF